ncbi:MAG: hypothetical protein ACOH5I_18200 [Oligoflexus sp.]
MKTSLINKTLICLSLAGSLLTQTACDKSDNKNKKKLRDTEIQLAEERKVQTESQKRINELLLDIAEKESKLAENETLIAGMEESQEETAETVKELEDENKNLTEEINEKLAELAEERGRVMEQDTLIASLNEKVAAFEVELAAATATITEKEEKIADLEAKLLQAGSDNDTSEDTPSTVELENLRQELSQAKADLAQARADYEAVAKSLAQAENLQRSLKFQSVQAFLETLGTTRDFVVGDRDLRKVYDYPSDKGCIFVFSFAEEMENLEANYSLTPEISGYETLPMGLKYQKVAVCEDKTADSEEVYQVHKENGRIFKILPTNNATNLPNTHYLLSSREANSCESMSSDVQVANVFSNKNQFIYPHFSPLNMIESFRLLRPNRVTMEYKMSRSVREFYAPGCTEVLARSNASKIAKTACRILNDANFAETNTVTGCFTEQATENNKPVLTFNQ